ncbi:MAG: pyridoxal-phosphate dependent enzyme [Acidimicrobiales bacterium]
MSTSPPTSSSMGDPDATGRFGRFGGRFVPETLMPACIELDAAFRDAWADPTFRAELDALLRDYAGRPSPLTECHRLSEELGVRVLLKREDLNHTGSHKINNVLGQALLTKRMGKTRLLAETGASRRAATAARRSWASTAWCTWARSTWSDRSSTCSACASSAPRSARRRRAAAHLKDAVNEAMRDWVATVETSHYCLGSVMGPHPYPGWCASCRVLGDEAREQCRALLAGPTPTSWWRAWAAAPTPPASSPGSPTPRRTWWAWRPPRRGGGRWGARRGARHDLVPQAGRVGQVEEAQSISAGLDYPGVGPEHAHLADIGRKRLPQRHRPGGGRRAPHPHPDRGDHPGARTGLTRCVGDPQAPALAGRTVLINLSGRGDQGRRPDHGPAGGGGLMASTMETHLAPPGRGPQAPCRTSPAASVPGPSTHAMADAGADAVEVGIPFSDPAMDGPVIQAASEQLRGGTNGIDLRRPAGWTPASRSWP